jgi:1,4-dihydroxy-2-naphthoyl-CoA synthase
MPMGLTQEVVSFVGAGQIDLEVQQVNSFKTIIYQKEGGVARITLNRSEVRNAVNLELITELNEALSTARADEGVRVVGDHRGWQRLLLRD